VPSSRGIIACCDELDRRWNDQRMLVLIAKILIWLVMARSREAFGDTAFGQSRQVASERDRGSTLFAAPSLAESGAEATHD